MAESPWSPLGCGGVQQAPAAVSVRASCTRPRAVRPADSVALTRAVRRAAVARQAAGITAGRSRPRRIGLITRAAQSRSPRQRERRPRSRPQRRRRPPRRDDAAAHRARVCRALPFDEALAMPTPDSARTSAGRTVSRGGPTPAGPGARQARRVAAHADAPSRQPFRVRAPRADHRGGFRAHPAARARRRPGCTPWSTSAARSCGSRWRPTGSSTTAPARVCARTAAATREFAVFGCSSLRFAFEDVMGEQSLGAVGPAYLARRPRGPVAGHSSAAAPTDGQARS